MRKKKREVIRVIDPEPANPTRNARMRDRKLTVGYQYAKEKKIPTLRLSGAWLAAAGFGINQKVLVRQVPGQLIIEILEEANVCMKTGTEDLNRPDAMESFRTGRKTSPRELIRDVAVKHGHKEASKGFKYLEKIASIKSYLDDPDENINRNGFKMHEFIYHSKLADSEKERIAIALKEALSVVEADRKFGRSQEARS